MCCSYETIIGIWGIPIIILGICDDGVNFLNNLTSNYTTFVYTICGIKFGLIENGYTLFKLGKLWIFDLFCKNCPSP